MRFIATLGFQHANFISLTMRQFFFDSLKKSLSFTIAVIDSYWRIVRMS